MRSIKASRFFKEIYYNQRQRHNVALVIFFNLFWSTLGSLFHNIYSHHLNNKIIHLLKLRSNFIHLNRWSIKYKEHIPYTGISLSFCAFELYIMGNFYAINWILRDRTLSDPVDHSFI